MRTVARAMLLTSVVLIQAAPAGSEDLLAMRVSTYAPGSLTIRLTTDLDPRNRILVVSAQAEDFYRSSEIQLNGKDAPRTTVLELRGLPTNVYEITGALVGTNGVRAQVIRMARVLPDPRRR